MNQSPLPELESSAPLRVRFAIAAIFLNLCAVPVPAQAQEGEGVLDEELEAYSDESHRTLEEEGRLVDQETIDAELAEERFSSETPAEDAIVPAALPSGDAQSAVTPQAISLPTAEGSIEGMGESFSPVLSAGTGTFAVPIALPGGRNGVQPSFGLSYSTSGGNSCAGFGWNLGVPFISRQTDRGLPNYVDQPGYHAEEDRFIYNGGQELVPVDSDAAAALDRHNPLGGQYADPGLPDGVSPSWQQYRARIEGGFMRFFRSPSSRQWVVQGKDGTRFDFGALPEGDGPAGFGTTSQNALYTEEPGASGPVYQWQLTRMSDAHGSAVYYVYSADQGQRYLADAYYLSPTSCAGGGSVAQVRGCSAPFADYGVRVHFDYAPREDVFSTYVAGWSIATGQRLERVTVTAAEAAVGTRYLVRRYHFTYLAGSYHSLLASVQVEGRPDAYDATTRVMLASSALDLEESSLNAAAVGRMLPAMRFRYSQAPAGPVAGFGGFDPTTYSVTGSPSHSVDEGRTDLFDVNSDGLVDVIVTDPARYRTPDGRPAVGVFFNGFEGRGATPTSAGSFSSAVPVELPAGLSGTMDLSHANIVPMDINGNGRSDFLHMPRRRDYGWFTPLAADEEAPGILEQGWSFDYQRVRLPAGTLDPRVDLDRDAPTYRALDVNNDHLVDLVRTTGTSMQTWLNLGWLPGGEGRFGSYEYVGGVAELSVDPITTCLPHAGQPVDFANSETQLADMNGDGIQDIVRLRRGRIVWWPGRGVGVWGVGSRSCGPGFASGRELVMANAPNDIPVNLDNVRLSDVNGDGASDLVHVGFDRISVWFNRAGSSWTSRVTHDVDPRAPAFSPRLRFADIDGSGTVDIVYANAGRWQYIDLMGGMRPRLLVGVENGLGAVTELEYESSSIDYLRDLSESTACNGCSDTFHWPGIHPVVTTVVRRMTTRDQMDQLGIEENRVVTEYAYHDGYYEGIEQELRGFGAADVIAVGDTWHPTSTSRTYFYQGKRYGALTEDRLADNPREPLKARAYLSEQFDEAGRYLSTTHTAYAVRELLTGLDGRVIRYAYVAQTDSFPYDVASWVRSEQTVNDGVFALRWERASATGTAVTRTDPGSVWVRGAGYAHLRSTVDVVDHVGNALEQTSHGRVVGEFGETPDEHITSHQEVALLDGGAWIWRTARGYVTGYGGPSRYGDTTNAYNAVGDLVLSEQLITAEGSLDFSGDGTAAGYALPASQWVQASTMYDAWGLASATCAGANIAESDAGCLRYAEVTYDGEYGQLPVLESIATERSGGAWSLLSVSATYQRGYGQILTSTGPNGHTTNVGYDGLGRLTVVLPPEGTGGPTSIPPQRFEYELGPEGRPINVIYSYQEPLESQFGGSETIQTRSYVDGLGRTRGVTTKAADGRWEQAGVARLSARGTPFESYGPSFLWVAPTPEAAVSIPTPGDTTGFHREPSYPTYAFYDAFGRMVEAHAEDGSPTITYHRALTTEVWDALDLKVGHPFYGTPSVSRVDGHGRAYEQLQINRPLVSQPSTYGPTEYYRLWSDYRPDGAVTTITRAQTAGTKPRDSAAVVGGRQVSRTFQYDSAGRRVSSTDPDTDNSAAAAGGQTWRYLFNRVGDLAAVRDPRGCGQNFYYDRAGRLIGEEYVRCAEAQEQGSLATETIPGDAVGLGIVGNSRTVDVRYYFDTDPPWVDPMDFEPASASPPRPTSQNLSGRLTGQSDRAQRTLYAYSPRGTVTWTGRQMALVPSEDSAIATTLADPPQLDASEDLAAAQVEYDATVYSQAFDYDHLDRPQWVTYPLDPDWDANAADGVTAGPQIRGRMYYTPRGLPRRVELRIDPSDAPHTDYTIIHTTAYHRDRQVRSIYFDDTAGGTRSRSALNFAVEPVRRRVLRMTFRHWADPTAPSDDPHSVNYPLWHGYGWDEVSNLRYVRQLHDPTISRPGERPQWTAIYRDALYRVNGTVNSHRDPDSLVWDLDDVSRDWRDEQEVHRTSDPMRERPAPMVPTPPSHRLDRLDYEWDWLANNTSWVDDANGESAFYERGIGAITNGFDEGLRPSALYLSTNLPTSEPSGDMTVDRGGWLELEYGAGGNVETMTVHGRCRDVSTMQACWDDASGALAARKANLRTNCVCEREQHYQYRWDELNRITEARRYDRSNGAGSWRLEVRQRYRYDAGNQRLIKQVFETTPDLGDPPERVHLYVYPGEFDRSGLRTNALARRYEADPVLKTESQYLVGGARVVWKDGAPNAWTLHPERRISYAISDLIQTSSMVFDLVSGDLLERRTFYPNGAQETLWTNQDIRFQPEPNGFTGKEGDDEVGLTYFGQRYLIPRIGRWASPDPLHVHAVGGGEALNSYHYISGNLLQGRDPLGLNDEDDTARANLIAGATPVQGTGLPNGTIVSPNFEGDGQLFVDASDFEGQLNGREVFIAADHGITSEEALTRVLTQRAGQVAEEVVGGVHVGTADSGSGPGGGDRGLAGTLDMPTGTSQQDDLGTLLLAASLLTGAAPPDRGSGGEGMPGGYGSASDDVVRAAALGVMILMAVIPNLPRRAGIRFRKVEATAGGSASRGGGAPSIRARLRAAGTDGLPGGRQGSGPFRYRAPEGYNPSQPLPRNGRQGGFMDRFGNEWQQGPYHGDPDLPFTHEWDVQLSARGRRWFERANPGQRAPDYINVRPDGHLSH